jgi:Domain of unknown function (DUF4328)
MSGRSNADPIPWVGENCPTNQRPPLGSGHRALGHALTVLLAGCVGLGTLTVMLDLYGIRMFIRWEADPSNIVAADGLSFDLMSAGLAGLQVLLLLATGIATMTWLYQAYGSREADPALLPFERWWTIGGWLIPVIWFVRPFELVRDLYRATASTQPPDRHVANVTCPARIRWWWAFWLMGNLLSNIAFMSAMSAPNNPDAGWERTAVTLNLVIAVTMIVAAVLFIGVLRSITSNLWRCANA